MLWSNAISACAALSAGFVGALYLFSDRTKSRNEDSVIKKRLVGVAVACASSVVFVKVAAPAATLTWNETLVTLNLLSGRNSHSAAIPWSTLPLLHTCVLFSGSIAFNVLEWLREWQHGARLSLPDRGWQEIRNYIVAPLSEELVFRACMVPFLVDAGFSHGTIIVLCPLFFGAAHLHHLYENVHHRKLALQRALVETAVQFTYTSLFGMYATYVLLCTRSLCTTIAVHALCNIFGVPAFGEAAEHKYGKALLAIHALALATFILAMPSVCAGAVRWVWS